MLDLLKQSIKIGSREEPISRYEVWWSVPGVGLFTSIQEAQGYETVLCVPVAIGVNGLYEVVPPEMFCAKRSSEGDTG